MEMWPRCTAGILFFRTCSAPPRRGRGLQTALQLCNFCAGGHAPESPGWAASCRFLSPYPTPYRARGAQAVLCGDVLATGWFCAERGRIAEQAAAPGGAAVAVLGLGPVGLMAAVAARQLGAAQARPTPSPPGWQQALPRTRAWARPRAAAVVRAGRRSGPRAWALVRRKLSSGLLPAPAPGVRPGRRDAGVPLLTSQRQACTSPCARVLRTQASAIKSIVAREPGRHATIMFRSGLVPARRCLPSIQFQSDWTSRARSAPRRSASPGRRPRRRPPARAPRKSAAPRLRGAMPMRRPTRPARAETLERRSLRPRTGMGMAWRRPARAGPSAAGMPAQPRTASMQARRIRTSPAAVQRKRPMGARPRAAQRRGARVAAPQARAATRPHARRPAARRVRPLAPLLGPAGAHRRAAKGPAAAVRRRTAGRSACWRPCAARRAAAAPTRCWRRSARSARWRSPTSSSGRAVRFPDTAGRKPSSFRLKPVTSHPTWAGVSSVLAGPPAPSHARRRASALDAPAGEQAHPARPCGSRPCRVPCSPTGPRARPVKGARRGRSGARALRAAPPGAPPHACLARPPAPWQRTAAAAGAGRAQPGGAGAQA